jgi:23S rRNA U2552 (ribose-2'-O)-methylase RlmE/FtsJ
MSVFDISLHLSKDFDPKFNVKVRPVDVPQLPSEKFGYDSSLNKYRNFIDNINGDDWKKVRWFINEYDFLVRDPIINRAFYKYWEIVNEFELFDKYQDKDLILHCAEAPGGFIQGTNIYLQVDRIHTLSPPKSITDDDGFVEVKNKRKKNKPDNRIFSISLNKDLPQYKSYNLPSYNKNVINKHVCITYGKDQTGDINNWDNIHHIQNLANDLFYLVTADGGFDEGTDFNNKEQLHYCLILSEIYAAMKLQRAGGNFVLKVFDVFTETSIHLLYLLSLAYEHVYVYKPQTSRPTNSEKYIVCKGFRVDDKTKSNILENLTCLSKQIKKYQSKYVDFTLFDSIPNGFVQLVAQMNKGLLHKQCVFLQNAVHLCQDEDFLEAYDDRLGQSIERRKQVFADWEQRYNLASYV